MNNLIKVTLATRALFYNIRQIPLNPPLKQRLALMIDENQKYELEAVLKKNYSLFNPNDIIG